MQYLVSVTKYHVGKPTRLHLICCKAETPKQAKQFARAMAVSVEGCASIEDIKTGVVIEVDVRSMRKRRSA